AALRPDGAARAPPRRAQDERALAHADGHRRQRHRHRRPARGRGAGGAPRRAGRPARVPHPPHPRRREELHRDGARARGMGGRAPLRPVAPRARGAAQAARQDEEPCGGGAVMSRPKHFQWRTEGKVGVITLNRPEKKNPLTFESYAELRDFFRNPPKEANTIVVTGAGGNFCSGGDVHEIIGPLTKMAMPQLLESTRMTGDLVKAMRHCPQPVLAAVEGVWRVAGAFVGMSSDLRYVAPSAKTAFLFVRVVLAGCDMGACTILPRIIGQC